MECQANKGCKNVTLLYFHILFTFYAFCIININCSECHLHTLYMHCPFVNRYKLLYICNIQESFEYRYKYMSSSWHSCVRYTDDHMSRLLQSLSGNLFSNSF